MLLNSVKILNLTVDKIFGTHNPLKLLGLRVLGVFLRL